MKINPGLRTVRGEVQRTEQSPNHALQAKSFSDMMHQQEQRSSQEQLQRMLEQIELQGLRLSKSMTVRELRAYRTLVKRFLDDTVRRGIGLKDTRGWDRRGRSKRYKLLDEIDRKLLDMADELLQSEQGRLHILQSIGEIRGMLINYAF